MMKNIGRFQLEKDPLFPPSCQIVEFFAQVTDTPVDELPPLQKQIDVDALNKLLDHTEPISLLFFSYCGYSVAIFDSLLVVLMEPFDPQDSPENQTEMTPEREPTY